MDVIIMYTAMLQVTALRLTAESQGPRPYIRKRPGELSPRQLATQPSGSGRLKRRRWVLEPECLGLNAGSATDKLCDVGHTASTL